MNNNLKITFSSSIAICYALFAFWSLSPYFTWSTYMGGILGKIGFLPIKSLFAIFSLILSGIYFFKKKKILTEMMQPAILLFAIVFLMLVFCGGKNSKPFDTSWLSFIAIIVLLILPETIKKQSFDIFVFLFTISLIIPLIIFILTEILKINIPYSVLYFQDKLKCSIGVFYKHRFLSAQITQNNMAFSRFNGIYYEAGVIGTLCGLLLGVYKFDIIGKNKWKQRLWLISGICSLSLSFILLTFLYFILKNIIELKCKNIIIIFSLLLLYSVFISINFSNPILQSIQGRVTFYEFKLQGDNRTSEKYELIFEKFNNSNFFAKLFGYGRDSFSIIQNENGFDGSSYKSIIYDYGYIGFFLYIFWFFDIIYNIVKKNGVKFKKFIIILVMQLANIYQKPDIFAIYYILIFIGGIILIKEKEKCNELQN